MRPRSSMLRYGATPAQLLSSAQVLLACSDTCLGGAASQGGTAADDGDDAAADADEDGGKSEPPSQCATCPLLSSRAALLTGLG